MLSLDEVIEQELILFVTLNVNKNTEPVRAPVIAWLEARDLPLPEAMAVRLDAKWIVPLFREVAGRLNSVLGFALIVFLFLMLGLLEVTEFMGKFKILRDEEAAHRFSIIC